MAEDGFLQLIGCMFKIRSSEQALFTENQSIHQKTKLQKYFLYERMRKKGI